VNTLFHVQTSWHLLPLIVIGVACSFYKAPNRHLNLVTACRWAGKDIFVPGVTSILRLLEALLQWAANMAVECIKLNPPILQRGSVQDQAEILEVAKTAHCRKRDAGAGSGNGASPYNSRDRAMMAQRFVSAGLLRQEPVLDVPAGIEKDMMEQRSSQGARRP
jgi:hypothetical protein